MIHTSEQWHGDNRRYLIRQPVFFAWGKVNNKREWIWFIHYTVDIILHNAVSIVKTCQTKWWKEWYMCLCILMAIIQDIWYDSFTFAWGKSKLNYVLHFLSVLVSNCWGFWRGLLLKNNMNAYYMTLLPFTNVYPSFFGERSYFLLKFETALSS